MGQYRSEKNQKKIIGISNIWRHLALCLGQAATYAGEALMKNLALMKNFIIFSISICLALAGGQVNAKKGGGGGGSGGGGGTDTGHVSMDAAGTSGLDFVVDAFQDCEERIAADDTSYLCNKSGAGHDIVLGDFLMNHVYPNGSLAANCFGDPGVINRVSIGVEKTKNGSAETVFWFHAFKNDRATEVLYVLIVNDPRGWSGPFPPIAGETTSMGELDGQSLISWDLGASNKRQERDACVDSGTFEANGTDFIKVDFKRIN